MSAGNDDKPLSRGQMRRQAMLDAATQLFLEKGYDRTSLSEIVSRSKGSRTTLYEQFGSKEGLLRAMIEDVTADIWTVVHGDSANQGGSEADLVELGLRFAQAALTARSIAVYRILAAEGARQPAIAQLFFELGPRKLETLVAERFRIAFSGSGMAAAPERLANTFLGSMLGLFHSRQVLGLAPERDNVEQDLADHVRLAVRVFLDGIGRLPEKSP